MAYSIRFTGIGKDGKELLLIEPRWWVISKIKDVVELEWITTNDTGSYTDDDADLSIDAARTLHNQFRPLLIKDIEFNTQCLARYQAGNLKHKQTIVADYQKLVADQQAELKQLDAAVNEGASEFMKFHICVYEWDSGL